jgi:hypothetical protein
MLEGKDYAVRSGAVVSGIFDMRREKHSLHFLVDGELLPHTIVNIPDNKKMHIGVFYFIYLFIFYYLFVLFIIYSSLLIVKSP